MVSQLRIYTIKPDGMDPWLKMFKETTVPLHQRYGIPVERAWVTTDGRQFVWVRNFRSEDSIEEQERGYYGSPERLALGDEPMLYIEKMEVRIVSSIYERDA
jgi:hypothetical protein